MRNLIYILLCLLLSSCARTCTSLDRSWQTGNRKYHIEQYSGGILVHTYNFYGILNNQEHSDGYYWYSGDTLYEVSGDIYLNSVK